MMLWILFLVCVRIGFISTDYALTHFDWRNKSFPKYWTAYIQQQLVLSFSSPQSKKGPIKKAKVTTMIHSLCGDSVKFLLTARKESWLCHEHYAEPEPLGPKVIQPTLKTYVLFTHCSASKHQKLWRQYDLAPMLSLNMTFLCMRLRHVYGSWLKNTINIHGLGLQFYFGGIQSKFSVYPGKFLYFELLFELFHEASVIYESSVISENLVTSLQMLRGMQALTADPLKQVQNILAKQLNVFTYKIEITKFQVLRIHRSMNMQFNVRFFVFVGPGFYSRKMELSNKANTTTIESFQCIVLTIIPSKYNKTVNNINYTGKNLKQKVVTIKNSTHSFIEFNSSKDLFPHTTVQFIFLVRSPPEYTVNVTFLRFDYTGAPETTCLFGGVSCYNTNSSDWMEEYCFCNKYIDKDSVDWHTARNIFSSSSTYLLILFAYHQYSSFHVKLQFSPSSCRTVKPQSICEIFLASKASREVYVESLFYTLRQTKIIHTGHKYCTVVQLSSGFYRVYPHKASPWTKIHLQNMNYPYFCQTNFSIEPTMESVTGIYTANFFGDYQKDGFKLNISVFDSDSTSGNYTLQQGEGHSQVHRTKVITSLSKLSCDLSTVCSLNKQNFLASAQFLFNNKLRFIVFLHPWSGSWVNIVMYFVERKQITFTLNHAVQLVTDESAAWANLPVATDTDKVLVLSSKKNRVRHEMLFFSFYIEQAYDQAAYLQARQWKSTDLCLSPESLPFVLAVPGKCTVLTLYTEVLQVPGNKTDLHA